MPRYELSDGTSNKFWQIDLSGKSFTTRYGKIGTDGQETVKTFATDALAKKEHDKLVAEKTKKGYQPAGGGKAPPKAEKPATTPAAKTAKTAKPAKPEKTGGMYFEFVEGSSSKFWEITLEGATVRTRYGKIGSDGQQTVKEAKSASDARTEHDRLVAEKTKKGYELVRGEAPPTTEASHAHDAKLEAAIVASPDDADLYLVYADWLQAHEDPRGELIVLQHANKTAEASKLLKANADHFWGKLADIQDMMVPYPYGPLGAPTAWRWGYLHTAWLSNKSERDRMFGDGKPEIKVTDALTWLLQHPSSRFLRELTIGIVSYESNSYEKIAKLLGEHPMPTLRKLTLGDFHSEETELNWSAIGNAEPLYAAVPNLESLTLRSGTMKLGKISLPKLRELVVITGGFDKGSLGQVCSAKWPALERLSLQLGRDGKITIKDLAPIFDGRAFPHVKHLGLGNSELADEICSGLASSKITAQLESIDLSKGTMGDEGAAALAAGSFPKLVTLDVSENYLTKRGLAALEGLAKQIDSKAPPGRRREAQRDDEGDPENRYIAAYE